MPAGGTFWDQLTTADRAALEAVGTRRRHEAGASLFVEGDAASTVVVIRRGRLKLTRTALDGRQVLIELRGPGELIGELGAIDDTPRSATATVAEPLDVITVPAERFRQLLSERGTIALVVLATVAARLRESATRRLESGTTDVMGRLCARLVQLAATSERAADGTIEISSALTQQDLAEWIGVSRDAVVLALRRMREMGWIETSRRRITICDLDAIRLTSGG